MERKYILINYTFISGEHEISSNTIVNVPDGASKIQIKNEVHEHMLNFWGVPGECVRWCESYSYFGGEIAVNVKGWHTLDLADILVLRRLDLSNGL
jgi:hypothetical protein